MIDKKTEISTPELNLFPIQGKNIGLSFNGDRISSDGGLLLLRELDSQRNLLSSASNCIHDERDQRYIDHSVKELLTQRVFQIAAGYEDCNDCNDLREDIDFITGLTGNVKLNELAQVTIESAQREFKKVPKAGKTIPFIYVQSRELGKLPASYCES